MLNIFTKTKLFIKKIHSTIMFMIRLIKLLIKNKNDELCFVTFDGITGDYKVLTFFSTIHSVELLYEVLKSMTEQLFRDLNKSDNPNHWSNTDVSKENILIDPGSKAIN